MTENTEKKTSWFDTAAAKLTAAVFAIGATLITARDAISRGFFKTVNKGPNGAFVDIQNERDAAIAAVTAPARSKKNPVSVANAPQEIRKINQQYEEAYKTRRKLLNFDGAFDEWKALKTHQRWEVAFASAAVASISAR